MRRLDTPPFQQHIFTLVSPEGGSYLYRCRDCGETRYGAAGRTLLIEPTLALHGVMPTLEEMMAAVQEQTVRDLGFPDYATWVATVKEAVGMKAR